VEVKALNQEGKLVEFRCGGLLGAPSSTKIDHLNGILFIDRMSKESKEDLRPELEALQAETRAALKA